tara:strand:+ start:404 stop:607 length:204 start_codon:yes stop_codon:yes gene_type:complete
MNPEILALIKSFEPDSRKPKDRYAEFLYYCNYHLDKMINRYINDFDRELLIKYILAHKKEITAELSK